MSKYEKNVELFEKLRGLSKKFNVTFVTAQQPPRDFVGRTKIIDLHPKSTRDIIIIDHVNLIDK